MGLGPLPDNETLLSWRNSPRIFKTCRQFTIISKEAQEKWRANQDADPSIKMFGLYDDFGVCDGVCGFTSIDLINRKAEFSLYISPNNQGKGYAKEALYVLFRHGFEAFNLELIYGETFAFNKALKLFEDFGMIKEATLRNRYYREGKYIDVHIISITKKEFCSRYYLCME
jgi:RimJ/RimL family protein N-acetyltransferase